MLWWVGALLWFAADVVLELLRPKPAIPNAPSGIGQITLPTAEEGRVTPLLFGTCKVQGPNCVWSGDVLEVDIKKDDVVIGHKYYIGEQLNLCHGPIDEIIDIRFDDKSIGGGSNNVTAAVNQIVFGNPGPAWLTATIPVGNYLSALELDSAATQAMNTAYGAPDFKVVFGYQFVLGVSDKLIVSVATGGGSPVDRTVVLFGSYASGDAVAAHVQSRLNAVEFATPGGPAQVIWKCSYDSTINKLTISWVALNVAVSDVYLRADVDYSQTCLANLGYQLGTDVHQTGTSGAFVADFPTKPLRYQFAFAGTTATLRLSDPAFTSAGMFGLAVGADITIGALMGTYDRSGPNGASSFLNISTVGLDKVTVTSTAGNLFGGADAGGGGGILGAIDIHPGTDTQVANEYLTSTIGVQLPGYRGICYAVFNRLYVGTSPYLKNPSFVLRRCPNQLGLADGMHNIGGDANPACVLYELLTNERWGIKVPVDLIDVASFVDAGEQLFAEGLGISLLVDQPTTGEELKREVERYIDGVIDVDALTGRLKLNLARLDYDINSLLVLDETNVESVEMSRPSWDDLKNSVRLRYIDREANFTPRVVMLQDSASWASRDGEISEEEFDFLGLSNETVAQARAALALKTLSYPLARLRLTAKRHLWQHRPASVAKLNWTRLGITNMPIRITRISTGSPDDRRIRVDALEDVFEIAGVGFGAVIPPGTDNWITNKSVEWKTVGPTYSISTTGENVTVTKLSNGDSIVVGTGPEENPIVGEFTRITGPWRIVCDDGQGGCFFVYPQYAAYGGLSIQIGRLDSSLTLLWNVRVTSPELDLYENKLPAALVLADGNALFMWTDDRFTNGTGVNALPYVQMFSPDGVPQWQENGIPLDPTGTDVVASDLIFDGANAIASWARLNILSRWLHKITMDGVVMWGTTSSPTQATGFAGSAGGVPGKELCTDGSGGVFITNFYGDKIRVSRVDSTGRVVFGPLDIAIDLAGLSEIVSVVADEGSVWVVWTNGPTTVWSQKINGLGQIQLPSGGQLGTAGVPSTTVASTPRSLALSGSANTYAAVTGAINDAAAAARAQISAGWGCSQNGHDGFKLTMSGNTYERSLSVGSSAAPSTTAALVTALFAAGSPPPSSVTVTYDAGTQKFTVQSASEFILVGSGEPRGGGWSILGFEPFEDTTGVLDGGTYKAVSRATRRQNIAWIATAGDNSTLLLNSGSSSMRSLSTLLGFDTAADATFGDVNAIRETV